MAEADYYRKLFDAVCKQSMEALAQTACEILNMPVVVTDAAFIVRAKYPDAPLQDEQWDANTLNRQIEPRFVLTFTDDDHFARHDEAGMAILTNWGHYEKAPRLTSIIRSGDGTALGYFAALATGVDVEAWHFEATDAIGKAFAVLMDAGTSTQMARAGFTSPALYALLDGSASEQPDLDMLPKEFLSKNRPPYMLFCARTCNPHNTLLEMYLGNELAQYFEHAIQTVYGGDLYILASGVLGDARGSVRSNLFSEALSRQKLNCGSSRVFHDLEMVRIHAWEATAALDVGARLGYEGPLFHYEDCIVDIACETLAKYMPLGALETEALWQLRRQDEANGTSYLKTLETYYEMRFDKKKTCEKLHIHRNTLQYRLDRLAEKLDLGSDGMLYAFYFALRDFDQRASKARSQQAGSSTRKQRRSK